MSIAAINSAKQPFDLATQLLWQHHWESRAEALRKTIATLVNDYAISEATAEVATMQAFADLDSVNTSAVVDMNHSTSSVVVLRQSNGHPIMLTARDLDRIIQQARDADLVQCVDADTRRPLVLQH